MYLGFIQVLSNRGIEPFHVNRVNKFQKGIEKTFVMLVARKMVKSSF